ncbi:MAG TPA: hypothetical protein VI383_08565 [Gemmatimonadales bacterium]|nr:hypothetical protein [Gemmatimonadales bacterium]
MRFPASLVPAGLIGLGILGGCGRGEPGAARDTATARDIQLPTTDTTLAIADRPAPAPVPAPAPAPPARTSAPSRPPAAAPAPPPAPIAPAAVPAPPAAPRIEAGTAIEAKVSREITSRLNKAGEMFTARIELPVKSADGRVVIPAGSEFTLTIVEIKPAPNRGAKDGTLVLRATSVSINGQSRALDAEVTYVDRTLKGRGVGTTEAAKVGVGAAAGAVIGKVIGGGTGAAAGAVTGAAAGAAVAVETADRDVVIPAGGRIVVSLRSPLSPD